MVANVSGISFGNKNILPKQNNIVELTGQKDNKNTKKYVLSGLAALAAVTAGLMLIKRGKLNSFTGTITKQTEKGHIDLEYKNGLVVKSTKYEASKYKDLDPLELVYEKEFEYNSKNKLSKVTIKKRGSQTKVKKYIYDEKSSLSKIETYTKDIFNEHSLEETITIKGKGHYTKNDAEYKFDKNCNFPNGANREVAYEDGSLKCYYKNKELVFKSKSLENGAVETISYKDRKVVENIITYKDGSKVQIFDDAKIHTKHFDKNGKFEYEEKYDFISCNHRPGEYGYNSESIGKYKRYEIDEKGKILKSEEVTIPYSNLEAYSRQLHSGDEFACILYRNC